MDQIYQNILQAQYLPEIFDSLDNQFLKEYYALFISVMGMYNVIKLDPEFAGKLYVTVINSKMYGQEGLVDKITDYVINKAIDNLEWELNNEKD